MRLRVMYAVLFAACACVAAYRGDMVCLAYTAWACGVNLGLLVRK